MQVPSPFAYEKATTVEQAIELLARHGSEARLLAGGHSLVPMMKLRLAAPETVIDINGISDLSYIRMDNDELCIGALTRHAELLASALAGEHFPIFHDAEKVIADPIVRNFGTVGGSLCHADPSEDLCAVFASLDGSAMLRGPDGSRTVPVRNLYAGPYETVLDPSEVMVELRVTTRPRSGSAYEKVERRVGDYAVAAAGAVLWLADDGTIAGAGIGLTAVGAPQYAGREAEASLVGSTPGEEVFATAGRIAAEHVEPVTDQRGPADYKRHLVTELTTRALRRAASRAELV